MKSKESDWGRRWGQMRVKQRGNTKKRREEETEARTWTQWKEKAWITIRDWLYLLLFWPSLCVLNWGPPCVTVRQNPWVDLWRLSRSAAVAFLLENDRRGGWIHSSSHSAPRGRYRGHTHKSDETRPVLSFPFLCLFFFFFHATQLI